MALPGWLVISGCSKPLSPPLPEVSPWEHQTWGVVPFVNESGVSTVDTARMADLFTQELEQVQGIDTVPVNRVIFAMRQLGLPWIASPAEAYQVMDALTIDAIVLGTVTAYDPYPPPTLGAAIQLFAREGARPRQLDPVALTRATSGQASPGELGPPYPIAQASGVWRGDNHQTLAWLSEYAAGRTEPDAPFGTETYLMSMELYTQFVSHRLIRDLLASERARQMLVDNQEPPR